MGRKRIELGAGADDQIVARMTRGESAESIAVAFGVSPGTMKRRMRELRGKVPAERRAAISAAAPAAARAPTDYGDAPEFEVPPDATLAMIDEWLARAKECAEAAAAIQNADEHATYMRMVIQLLEARRKATPLPKIDPNENPDMVEAAKKVRKRWHDLADALVRVSESSIAPAIAKLVLDARRKEKAGE